MPDDEIKQSPAKEFGHVADGYAVEFNLNGICACRTLTMETEDEAEVFKEMLKSEDYTKQVEIVYDG